MIKDLEKDIGVPQDFFEGLLKEDDWSFVIKLHALFEAAVNHLLIEVLDGPELRSVISRLALNNPSTGRLAYLKNMKLLDSHSLRFLQRLSELRNRFVHDVGNVDVDLNQFFSGLDSKSQQRFYNGFKWGYEHEDEAKIKQGDLYDLHEFIKALSIIVWNLAQYKIAIWLGSIIVFRQIYSKVARGQYEKEMRKIDRQLSELLERIIDHEL